MIKPKSDLITALHTLRDPDNKAQFSAALLHSGFLLHNVVVFGLFWGTEVFFLKLIGWMLFGLFLGLGGMIVITGVTNAVIDEQTPVRLAIGPTVSVASWDQGYVAAEGTFVIDNDRQAFPFQVTKVECFRDERFCTAARAEVAYMKMLNVELDRYEISLWNTTTLQFRVNARCVEYVYTIDRASQRLIGRRTKKTDVAGCDIVQDKPLTLSLSSGHDVWTKINKEAQASAAPWMWVSIVLWWIVLVFFGWRWRPRL